MSKPLKASDVELEAGHDPQAAKIARDKKAHDAAVNKVAVKKVDEKLNGPSGSPDLHERLMRHSKAFNTADQHRPPKQPSISELIRKRIMEADS